MRCGLRPSVSRAASSQWVTSCSVLKGSCVGSSVMSSFAPFSSAMGWSDFFLFHPSIVMYLHWHLHEPPEVGRQAVDLKTIACHVDDAIAASCLLSKFCSLAFASANQPRSAEVSQ